MLRRATLLLLLLFCLSLGTWAVAASADPIRCPSGSTPDPSSGECLIIATQPGGGGSSSGGSSGATTKPTRKVTCTYTLLGKPKDVPCSSVDGSWSQSQQAYCKAASPQ